MASVATESFALGFEVILPFFDEVIRKLVLDETIGDLCINGNTGTYVERDGRMENVGHVVASDDMLPAIQNIARILGEEFSQRYPILDARLPNGSRVSAIGFYSSPIGTSLVIRKFLRWFSSADFMEMGTLPQAVFDAVRTAMLNHENILISGGTGTGKTSMLKSFADHIPLAERVITLERPIEMRLDHENIVRLEAGKGVEMSDLLVASLRQRPDRIILGEVRDAAAFDLLQAMNTGHSGTLSTIHASSAAKALYRLSGLALSAHSNIDHSFIRSETADAINLVMHINRFPDGARRVTELLLVDGYDAAEKVFKTTELYKQTSRMGVN